MSDDTLQEVLTETDRDIAAAARLGAAATHGTPLTRGQPRAFLVPDGYTLHTAEPAHRDDPRRIIGTVDLHTPDALVEYVGEHNEGGATVYADMPALRLTAVINDDDDATPDWRDHRAVVELQSTPEWDAWTSRDGRLTSQEDFGEFLEQRAHEIVSPDAATMIEVARTFEAKRDVQFRRAFTPQSGTVEMLYDETIEGKAGRGSIAVPDAFTIVASPFYGAEPLSVVARFRYRLRGGDLLVGYSLLHVDRLMDDTFNDLVDGMRDNLEGVPVLRGVPPSARTDDGSR